MTRASFAGHTCVGLLLANHAYAEEPGAAPSLARPGVSAEGATHGQQWR